jgi:hypothetical protein
MPDLLFRSLADIDEAETANIEPYDLTPMPKKMPDLDKKLTALVEEANASSDAFAGIGTVPVEGGIKKEFYFTLVVPAPEPTSTTDQP